MALSLSETEEAPERLRTSAFETEDALLLELLFFEGIAAFPNS